MSASPARGSRTRQGWEIESVDELEAYLADGHRTLRGCRLQDVDLTAHDAALRALDPAGALLLGCALTPDQDRWLREHGALVFPRIPAVPFDAYRAGLYDAEELYAGLADGYAATYDARVYAWSRSVGRAEVAAMLAQGLHDLAIDDALEELATDLRRSATPVTGVMGGHAVPRDAASYREAAHLARRLAGSGRCVATGGGPGAMEAANLGARCAGAPEEALAEALARLGTVPGFGGSASAWAAVGLDVARSLPGGDDAATTLGVPTWFYGHEPPNPFATHIAKLFRNALREDTLLRLCDGGIVFLPGSAGTVQEIFQDACENYYADPADRAPMVLVGAEHWTSALPAWPLLRAMADERGFGDRVHLVADVDAACEVLLG